MKLAIVAIMKNEDLHIGPWLQGLLGELRPDDSIVLLDTGSTDDTIAVAQYEFEGLHDNVALHHASIKPWRFDTARNTALALADPSADMVWALDLDEFPQPGWRQAIEDAYRPEVEQFRYRFVWSFTEDGSEGYVFHADKIFSRHGFIWKGIAHEWPAWQAEGSPTQAFAPGLVVHHRQDHSIDRRGRDMALMERAIAELPDDERLQFYYARQLLISGRNVEASEALQRHLANPRATWRAERAESMMLLAQVGGNEAWNHQWLYRALAEAPERRETWLAAAEFEISRKNYQAAMSLLGQALRRPRDEIYLSRPTSTDDAIIQRAVEVRKLMYEREVEHGERDSEVHHGAATEAAAHPEVA
jgi:tetratricopeptide (TPR) repeat protein